MCQSTHKLFVCLNEINDCRISFSRMDELTSMLILITAVPREPNKLMSRVKIVSAIFKILLPLFCQKLACVFLQLLPHFKSWMLKSCSCNKNVSSCPTAETLCYSVSDFSVSVCCFPVSYNETSNITPQCMSQCPCMWASIPSGYLV